MLFELYYKNTTNGLKLILFSLFISSLVSRAVPARTLPDALTELTAASENATWHNFVRFLDAEKGSDVKGISELKKYFQRFGYMIGSDPNTTLTDLYDDDLERAVLAYQKNMGLSGTGIFDSDTMAAVTVPRCGVGDEGFRIPAAERDPHAPHTTAHYAYFDGEPRWDRPSPMMITYSFSPTHTVAYLNSAEVKAVFKRAFARWSAVIPVNFTEAEEYSTADVKIGFHRGDHGDGKPFDGTLGVLAHAFSPENGRFHLDGEEKWAVNFDVEKSKVAVDLESVATHEIGHILGLAHSSVKEAVMYPSLTPRTKKVDLRIDDVDGIQKLYGSNPNFKYSSLHESDISSGQSIRVGPFEWVVGLSMMVIYFFLVYDYRDFYRN